MLTKRQRELLIFMQDYIRKHGVVPSYQEIKTALGLESSSSITRLVVGLDKRGYIRRLPRQARAIEIVRTPDLDERDQRIARPQMLDWQPMNDCPRDGSPVVVLSLWGQVAVVRWNKGKWHYGPRPGAYWNCDALAGWIKPHACDWAMNVE